MSHCVFYLSFRCQETSCYYTTMQDMQLSQSCLLFQLLLLPVSILYPSLCDAEALRVPVCSGIRPVLSERVPAESRESCASGVLQLVRRLHSSTSFGFGMMMMMIPNVQFFRLNFRISPRVPLFLCHSNWSSWLNCPGDFWRNNDNWMPVLLAEFGGPGPRGVLGHFLGMVSGFEFLVQIFVCWAQALCFHKYEQRYDCAVAIRRPIQGMTHSVPTISGSTVFAREQATAAQVLTMGRRIGTRAWNQTRDQ